LRKETKSNRRGMESDDVLLRTIGERPGFSQYELARKIKWHSGHVDGSIRRLLKSKKVFLRVIERNGRKVNLVYPEEFKESNLIEVPSKLLEIGNPTWNGQAFFYALDSSTIGVSGYEMVEWKEISCLIEDVPIARNEEGKISFRIPEKFWRFYNLDRKHRVVSINGNNLLVTVAGDIIEEKRYPS
jgi:hypothetical protein